LCGFSGEHCLKKVQNGHQELTLIVRHTSPKESELPNALSHSRTVMVEKHLDEFLAVRWSYGETACGVISVNKPAAKPADSSQSHWAASSQSDSTNICMGRNLPSGFRPISKHFKRDSYFKFVLRWASLLKQQSSITGYHLPTKENKLPFSVSVFCKQTEVFRFPLVTFSVW
jgi:hypothetical protein